MATCTKVRTIPTGDAEAAYGPVEIAWYPDRLEITAVGAGQAAVTEARPSADGRDVVVEIRLPALDEVVEAMPGAD